MKKIQNLVMVITVFSGLLFFVSSCGDEPIISDLTLTVTPNKTIVMNGDVLELTISAVTTNDKITSVTAVKSGGGALTLPAVSDNKNYNAVAEYVVNDPEGDIEFTVTVSSEENSTPEVKTIKVKVVTEVEVTLGASQSPLPSFINGTTLTTYTATQAFANQNLVDLVYTWSDAEGAIIGAPSDDAFVLANWTTKHTTKIARIAEESLTAIAGVSGTSVRNLVVGDLLGYITDSGTQGIIKVTAIVVNANGNSTFKFKVIK